MKSFNKLVDELNEIQSRSDKRLLAMEKGMYAHWRDAKMRCIEGARRCKQLGLNRLQLRYQNDAAKYDSWAKESKRRIREYGARIYAKDK